MASTRSNMQSNDLQIIKKPPTSQRKRIRSAPRKPFQVIDLESPQSWLQLPDESSQAYQAFDIFLHMEPKERSLTTVANQLYKSLQLIFRWSKMWAWYDRVLAWDNYQQRVRLEKEVHDRAQMAQRHINISLAAQQKMVARLQSMKVEDMRMGELMRSLRIAVQIERLARGEPTEITDGKLDLNLTGKVVHGHINLEKLSDKELRTLEILVDKASEDAPDEGSDQS